MARHFNGTSDFLVSAASIDLSALNKVTWSFFHKADFLHDDNRVGFRHGLFNNNGSVGLNMTQPGSSGFQCDMENPISVTGFQQQPSPGIWHHIAVVIDGQNASQTARVKFYVDGVQQTSLIITAGAGLGTNFINALLYIGSDFGGAAFFDAATMFDFAIFNKLLSAADIANLAAGIPADKIGGCINYWKITGASPELPTVGAVNLTVNGTTVVASPSFPLPVDVKNTKGLRSFLDNFDGTLATDLRAHTPNQGAGWLAAGTWTNIYELSGVSTPKLSANNLLVRAFANQNQPGNCIISSEWFYQDTANSDQCVIFRYQASPEKFYFIQFSDTEGKIILRRSDVGGGLTRLVDVSYNSFFNGGQTSQYEPFEIHVLNGITKMYHGSLLKLYYDDTAGGFTDSNKIGIQKTFDRPAPHTQLNFLQVNSVGGILPQFLQSSPPFPAIFDDLVGYDEEEGNNLFCRQTLERIYTTRVVKTGELVWAYQVKREYCADWLFLSPGLLVDPAAVNPVLNTGFGIRVYETVATKDDTWIVDTVSANTKLGGVRPVWTQPAWYGGYIPWSNRPCDLLIELYNNGAVTPAAGSIMELAIAMYKDVVNPNV